MSNQYHCRLGASFVFACTLFWSAQSLWGQQAKVVAEALEDYEENCVACHGSQGRGDGEMARILVKPPSDLTQITERYGRFPFWRIYSILAGDVNVPGHDTFQMPQFLARMAADEGKPGYLPTHIRILLLTHYLESLQERSEQ